MQPARWLSPLCLSALPSTQAPEYPGAGTLLQIGQRVSDVALADLNGDGALDVVTVDPTDGNQAGIQVAQATGPGTFGAAALYTMPSCPDVMAVADLDADGMLDVVAQSDFYPAFGWCGVDEAYILLNAGQGVLQYDTTLAAPANARRILAADLTLDGLVDVVLKGEVLATTYVQAPGFQFQFGQTISAWGSDVDVAFVDGNLYPDLVFGADYGFRWYAGGPAGFSQKPVVPGPVGMTQIMHCGLGDFTADGKLDVIVLGAVDAGLVPGDGSGGFGVGVPLGTDGTYADVMIGDLEGNGTVDAVLRVAYDGQATILHGLAAGGIGYAGRFALDGWTACTALGDVDGDGALDLACGWSTVSNLSLGSTPLGEVRILRGDGTGRLIAAPCVDAGGGNWIYTAVVSDFDRDGAEDVLAITPSQEFEPQALQLLRGDGAGGLAAPVSTLVSTAPAGTIASRSDGFAFDANADGNQDFVVWNVGPGLIGLFEGDGAGGFDVQNYWTDAYYGGGYEVAVADLDLDGFLDLASGAIFAANKIYVHYGTGTTSGFGPGQLLTLSGGIYQIPGQVAAGDIDGDGMPDLVSAQLPSPADHYLLVSLLGDGQGGFTALPPLAIDVPENSRVPQQSELVDLDGDGDLDLAVVLGGYIGTNYTDGFAGSLLGDGAGGFSALPTVLSSGTSMELHVADVNGDQHLDLVTSGENLGHVSVLLGDGAGTFAEPLVLASSGETADVELADLNADGRVDLVACSRVHSGPGALVLFHELSVEPAGLAAVGAGTPGCNGILGISASSAPYVGNAGFALLGSHAPSETFGWLVLAAGANAAGADPLGIGLLLHFDLGQPWFVFPAGSDLGGLTSTPMPIPSDPGLGGAQATFQYVWMPGQFPPCQASLLGLSSSPGLTITIQ